MLTGRMKAPKRSCRFSPMTNAPVCRSVSAWTAVSKPANARHHLGGKSAHFCFEWLELEHKQLNPRIGECPDAFGYLVVAADQAGGRAPVAADARRLRHGLS